MGDEGELVGLRLARGCRCFAAVDGSEVTAYGWLSTGTEWIGEIRLEIRPEAGEVYVWNCLTLPAHRRRGMFRAVLVRISSVLKEEGAGRLWIASGGTGAEKALPDAGFQPVLLLGESPLGRAPLRLLRVTAAKRADPTLVFAGRRALGGGGGGPLPPIALARRPGFRRH